MGRICGHTAGFGRVWGRMAAAAVAALAGIVGCGGGGGGKGTGEVIDPGTIEFRVFADNRITETRFYGTTDSRITAAGAAQLLTSDLQLFGHAHFGAYDTTVQSVDPTAVWGNARFRVDLTAKSGDQVAVRIVDTLPQVEQTVATFTLSRIVLTPAQVLNAMHGSVASALTAQAVAEAVALVAYGV